MWGSGQLLADSVAGRTLRPTTLAELPYLGRAREVTHYRLMNAQDAWEANDLDDLHHLACAAGYADIVVGEKKFHYLQRAERAPPGTNRHRRQA